MCCHSRNARDTHARAWTWEVRMVNDALYKPIVDDLKQKKKNVMRLDQCWGVMRYGLQMLISSLLLFIIITFF